MYIERASLLTTNLPTLQVFTNIKFRQFIITIAAISPTIGFSSIVKILLDAPYLPCMACRGVVFRHPALVAKLVTS